MFKFNAQLAFFLLVLPAASVSKTCGILNPSSFAVRGGFNAPVDSSARWKSGGHIKIDKGYLCPYLYTRIWGESGRETSRLVVFDNNYNYLGSYSLVGPLDVRVKNNKLVVRTMMGRDDLLIFRSTNLPDRIYVAGEYVELFK